MRLIVNMACGLANRMFQYSYYLFLKKKGYNAQLDFYNSAKLPHEKVDWNEIFPKADLNQASHFEVFMLGGGGDIFSRFRRRLFPGLTKVIKTDSAFDVYLPSDDLKSGYIIGVFQNANMVEFVKDEVLNAFLFPLFQDEKNKMLEQEMRTCESVAIHVRKGKDYQSRIWYQKTCPLEYYKEAIEMIKSKISHPKFYVFTDNPTWVKENFSGIDYYLIEGNPSMGYGSHFDMQLMSICKHNIISNSTYSWWGAFLNRNKDKMVIVPRIWFNPDSCDEFLSNRALCKGWISL